MDLLSKQGSEPLSSIFRQTIPSTVRDADQMHDGIQWSRLPSRSGRSVALEDRDGLADDRGSCLIPQAGKTLDCALCLGIEPNTQWHGPEDLRV